MWLKVDDKMHDHRKVQQLLEGFDETDALAALGLWLLAGSWSGDQMSDGLVSGFLLKRWHSDWQRLAAMLVDVGLWEVVDVDGRPHHQFHDWTDYNDPRAKIMADREAEKMRTRLMRDTRLVAAIKKRDQDRCRYCGCQVRWGNQRGPEGATYDHVKPVSAGGLNTLDNVVIACRGCNSRKRHLSLKDAGMRRLKAGTMGAPAPERTPRETPEALSPEGSTHGTGRVGSGPQSDLSTDPDPPAPKRTKSSTTRSKTRSTT